MGQLELDLVHRIGLAVQKSFHVTLGLLRNSIDVHNQTPLSPSSTSEPASKPKVMRLDPTHSVAYIEFGKAASMFLFIHAAPASGIAAPPRTKDNAEATITTNVTELGVYST